MDLATPRAPCPPPPLHGCPLQAAPLQVARRTLELLLIDGYNVLHACCLRGKERGAWWHGEGQQLLLQWLAPIAQQRVVVVFDRSATSTTPMLTGEFGAQLVYAEDADAEIVARVRGLAGSSQVGVVSADRALRDRCRASHVVLIRPWEFARELDAKRQDSA